MTLMVVQSTNVCLLRYVPAGMSCTATRRVQAGRLVLEP